MAAHGVLPLRAEHRDPEYEDSYMIHTQHVEEVQEVQALSYSRIQSMQ